MKDPWQLSRDYDTHFGIQTLPDSLESPDTLLLAYSRIIQFRHDLAGDRGRGHLRFSRATLAGAAANARVAMSNRLSQLNFSTLSGSRGGRK
jgi:hypothetical protein